MVIGPSGRLLARAGQFEETVLTARLDPGDVCREQTSAPLLRDENIELTVTELTRIRTSRHA